MSASQGSDNADLLLSNEVIRTLASELQRLRDKVAELEKDREDLTVQRRRKDRKLEEENSGLQRELDAAREALQASRGALRVSLKEVRDMIEISSHKQVLNRKLKEKSSGLQRELDTAREALRAVQASNEDLRVNFTKVKQELDETSHQSMAERLEHGCVVDTLTKRISELTDNHKQVKLEADLDQDSARFLSGGENIIKTESVETCDILKTPPSSSLRRQLAEPEPAKGSRLDDVSNSTAVVETRDRNGMESDSELSARTVARGSLSAGRNVPMCRYRLRPRPLTNAQNVTMQEVSSSHPLFSNKRASDDDQSGSRKKPTLSSRTQP